MGFILSSNRRYRRCKEGLSMAQIIKFPTPTTRQKREIESEIQVAEEALRDYMEELDMLNKEIAHLTSLYEQLVNELMQLELKEE
jgi:predicted  nucleic acid-binding Zn-ribbon protein